jgi:archaellum component FlaC
VSEDYNKLLDMWRGEKDKRQSAENEVERLKKEIPMIREDVQVELLQKDKRILDLETIDKGHQKQMGELIEDNKKLSKQIQDLDKVKELRSKGLI